MKNCGKCEKLMKDCDCGNMVRKGQSYADLKKEAEMKAKQVKDDTDHTGEEEIDISTTPATQPELDVKVGLKTKEQAAKEVANRKKADEHKIEKGMSYNQLRKEDEKPNPAAGANKKLKELASAIKNIRKPEPKPVKKSEASLESGMSFEALKKAESEAEANKIENRKQAEVLYKTATEVLAKISELKKKDDSNPHGVRLVQPGEENDPFRCMKCNKMTPASKQVEIGAEKVFPGGHGERWMKETGGHSVYVCKNCASSLNKPTS